ncbi:extracellular ligand-binding receptor [Tolypothrix tenuis PCC 7101]|uniref:Extracellular ligand-binding receptor n=1 Tax=Tolypothrix tenuis PCC 7101 TaxID=231146 RepID=A0A1Z4MTE8_9CYAN|nr:amino acid ABC transporter substrate-binding protein [Aulosira sp. FACHB-113]BAY96723.1 extracellular ligand-binding receptor [Tolypothrix tenuis PCC 7101]BAZ72770.1 extracellular ligand-binding receptor [Aulosira laxa NIES-50]
MNSQKEIKLLILSLLCTTAVLGLGLWVWNQFSGNNLTSLISGNSSQPGNGGSQSQRISLGGKILVAADTSADKEAGVQAFAKGDFATASTKLKSSLQKHRNDPESLIYFNNSQTKNTNSLKIAVSVPIGGNLDVAKEILRGVAQAQDEVNRSGGINGKLLQVAIANDDNEANQAQQIAKQFVQDKSILAVVGHNSSNASIAAAPIYQEGGLVMISPSSTAQNLSGIGNYIFRTVPSNGSFAASLANYTIKTARKNNIAICADSKSIDTQSFKDEFIKGIVAGGGKVNPTNCDVAAADFNPSALISQFISSGADSLVLAPHVDRINKALDLAAANSGKLTLFASPTLYTFQTLQVGKSDVNGLVLAIPWHPQAIPGNPFPQNAVKLWGGNVNWRTATAYDATIAIAKGLQQDSTRDGLEKALHSPSLVANGATGRIQFLPSGDRNGTAVLVKIQPSNKSATGYDFMPL